MGNRAVKQPNGLFARFSEIVDDFTHANCSREELWAFYRDEGGVECANGKLQRADENANRFDEAIDIIKRIHGEELAERRRKELSEPPQDIMRDKILFLLKEENGHIAQQIKLPFEKPDGTHLSNVGQNCAGAKMLEYLNINNCSYGEIVNKINECVRSLNIVEAGKQSGKTPAQHQLAICAACGNLIKPGKPAATGFHCVLCGAALPHNIDMKNGVWEGGAGNTEEFL